MQKNKMPVPTEAQEQMTLFSWAAMQSGKYPELNLLYHVPNGGSRHKAEAGRLRAEGVKAGVPDLCLPVARGQWTLFRRRATKPRFATAGNRRREQLSNI